MSFRSSRQSLLLATLMLLMVTTPFPLLASDAGADQSLQVETGEVFLPSEDALGDLQAALKRAESEHKLALVILGANWCHDSLALAVRLQAEPLKSLVDEKYATVFVDVGNLSEGRDVIQSLGIPIYYATPTVLIVDPGSGRLVNYGNLNMWGSAASISMADSVSYFQTMADIDLSALPDEKDFSAEQIQLMAEIDGFEQIQADRLSDAYLIAGAMLDNNFDRSVWMEIGKFRNSVAANLDELRAEVSRRIADGETGFVLSYPNYPPWSWSIEVPVDDEY